MIISKRHGFIFVAVGRTGTTSIEAALQPFDDYQNMECELDYKGHAPLSELQGQVDLENYYKFGFVRNPWDLAVSKYLFHKSSILTSVVNRTPLKKLFFRKWVKGESTAKKFAQDSESLSNLNIQYEYPLIDMHDFFTSKKGRLIVDDIFRFENIKNDFKKALEKIGLNKVGLPHKNRSRKKWKGISSYKDLKE